LDGVRGVLDRRGAGEAQAGRARCGEGEMRVRGGDGYGLGSGERAQRVPQARVEDARALGKTALERALIEDLPLDERLQYAAFVGVEGAAMGRPPRREGVPSPSLLQAPEREVQD